MNEARLRRLLRETPVPESEAGERRGLEVLESAFDERREQPRSTSLPRLAIAFAIATLLAALLLSPAGAAVRDWVDEVFTAQTSRTGSGLAEIPGGGRLLIQSQTGPWVVQPDGSRRLLGEFDDATWSPRGLFVAAASGRTLNALEPDGTPRWSLSADGLVLDPRWSPSGVRIAYRSGSALRVTAADGTGDRLIDPRVAAVAPAWFPQALPRLAYVGADGDLRVADTENGESVRVGAALPAVDELEWSGGLEGYFLERSRLALQIRGVGVEKLAGEINLSPPRRLTFPAGAEVRDAAISPHGKLIAVLLRIDGQSGPRSVVTMLIAAGGAPRRLLNVPGRLEQLAFSPNGGRLLVTWPGADQWLFLPTERGEPRSVTEVSAAFAPGERAAAFPRVEGWCCQLRIGASG